MLPSLGVLPVIPDCISFNEIPHTTKLFSDFLSNSPSIRPFFTAFSGSIFTKNDSDSLASRVHEIRSGSELHRKIADVLEHQNAKFGLSEPVQRNIQRLREGAHAIVTGQQVGLFGGPLLGFLKVASVLALTQQLDASGVPSVPVFWMASEDHDLAEVNQSFLLTHDFQLFPFQAETKGVDGSPVSNIRLGAGTSALVQQACELLGDSDASEFLRESYREGETLSQAFAKLYARIFVGRGLIILDPADKELHRLAAPLFVEAIQRVAELDDALLARNRELAAAGYHEQVKVTDLSTPLFAIVDGARVPVHRANGQFSIGTERLSPEELIRRIQEHPQDFNANVVLRPVLQDYWLPTLAYFGGPAEIAYFAQVGVVYEKLLGRITPILPRLSATLVEPRIERLVEKYQVQLPELFHGECELRDCIAARSLPPELKHDFSNARLAIDEGMQRISQSLSRLDPTLVRASERAAAKMLYQVNRLERRAAAAELRRNEVIARHAAQIENSLYPHKSLQEREISGIYFYATYGPQLLDVLLRATAGPCPEHKLIRLG
jgi:bacillithiol biosynthesis cysteine-adding enzyme BshC